jgi:hypothetical protein
VERNRGDAIRENADKVIKAVKLKMKEVEKIARSFLQNFL